MCGHPLNHVFKPILESENAYFRKRLKHLDLTCRDWLLTKPVIANFGQLQNLKKLSVSLDTCALSSADNLLSCLYPIAAIEEVYLVYDGYDAMGIVDKNETWNMNLFIKIFAAISRYAKQVDV